MRFLLQLRMRAVIKARCKQQKEDKLVWELHDQLRIRTADTFGETEYDFRLFPQSDSGTASGSVLT